MTRVCVVGACGRMGEAVRRALSETPGLELGGALELPGHPALSTQLEGGVRVVDDPKRALAGCGAAIDFKRHTGR